MSCLDETFIASIRILTSQYVLIMLKTKKEQGLLQVPNRYNQLQANHFTKPLERKIFFAIALMLEKNISPQLDLSGTITFEVPTSVLGRPSAKSLESAFENLYKPMKLRTADPDDNDLGVEIDTWTFFNRLTYRRGKVIAKLSPDGYDFLTQFTQKEGYFWAHLKGGLSLSSIYAQHWYGVFSQYANFGKLPNMTIDKIVHLHSVGPDQFINKRTGKRKNSDLIIWTVYKPIEEINKKTNLFIEYTPINNQKKPLLGFDFSITKKGPGENFQSIRQIENFVEQLRNSSDEGGKAITNKLAELSEEYSLPDDACAALLNEGILNKVMSVDHSIKKGTLIIKQSKSAYMQKVIQKELDLFEASEAQ